MKGWRVTGRFTKDADFLVVEREGGGCDIFDDAGERVCESVSPGRFDVAMGFGKAGFTLDVHSLEPTDVPDFLQPEFDFPVRQVGEPQLTT